MFRRFKQSRGVKKFRRNRSAMIALSIIAVYFALAMWVWTMEAANWFGSKTGLWNLSSQPVLSMLLPSRAGERVGPRWLPAFWGSQDTTRREDQADFLLKLAEDGIDAAEAVEREAGPEAAAEKLRTFALAERQIAALPVRELQTLRADARSAFDNLDNAKRARTAAQKVATAAETAINTHASMPGPTTENRSRAVDDLSAAIEEVMFSIEDYTKMAGSPQGGDDGTLASFKADKLQDAADAVRDAPADVAEIPFPSELIASIRTSANTAVKAELPKIAAALDALEPKIERLVPMPSGFSGTLYWFRTSLGTDAQGRSIMIRGLYSTKIAIQVGVIVALVSVIIGALMGAAAGYFSWLDHVVTWLYSTLSSLPQLVLLAVLAFMFLGSSLERTLIPIYVALCLTFWIGPCRVIRGEVMKIKQLEYAQAATVIGFSRWYILLKHVLPNTMHLMFINFSLLFIGAIKTEVILTFLGLGIKEGASWGLMISQAAPEVVNGIFWQIGAATVFMLVLVLAFNVVSDALQDAFDPKHVG